MYQNYLNFDVVEVQIMGTYLLKVLDLRVNKNLFKLY